MSPKKCKALQAGARLAAFAPASPASDAKAAAGFAELARLGFVIDDTIVTRSPDGYFAATSEKRVSEFIGELSDNRVDGLVAVRGGYGSNYLLDDSLAATFGAPKAIIGFSDLTSLQIFLWQKRGWVTFYGPMVAAGLDGGAGRACGYDEQSFRSAVSRTDAGWEIPLRSESLVEGEAKGRVLGGCMTLLEATLGTPWELDTRDSILVLEDRGMKPWQIDRALMHLQHAGKLAGVRGVVLGDFPECDAPIEGSPTARDVCMRILGALGVPMVFGSPIGHTLRPMLTLPLGVRANLRSKEGVLEILEPAVEA
jgi:muramoyltetrapeptide carboxypeptidase